MIHPKTAQQTATAQKAACSHQPPKNKIKPTLKDFFTLTLSIFKPKDSSLSMTSLSSSSIDGAHPPHPSPPVLRGGTQQDCVGTYQSNRAPQNHKPKVPGSLPTGVQPQNPLPKSLSKLSPLGKSLQKIRDYHCIERPWSDHDVLESCQTLERLDRGHTDPVGGHASGALQTIKIIIPKGHLLERRQLGFTPKGAMFFGGFFLHNTKIIQN